MSKKKKASEEVEHAMESLPPAARSLIEGLMAQSEIEALGEGRFKIELDLGLERLWRLLMMWSLATFGVLMVAAFAVQTPEHWFGIILALVLAGVFAGLYKLTDQHFVLDLEQKSLWKSRRFLGIGGLRKVAMFSELSALVVEARTQTRQGDGDGGAKIWRYRVTAIDKDGGRVPLSDYRSLVGVQGTNGHAEALSELMEIPAFPGKEKHFPRWTLDADGGLVVEYEESNTMWKHRIADGLLGLLGYLVGFSLLAGLYFWSFG